MADINMRIFNRKIFHTKISKMLEVIEKAQVFWEAAF